MLSDEEQLVVSASNGTGVVEVGEKGHSSLNLLIVQLYLFLGILG